MLTIDSIVLYVKNLDQSMIFYARAFDCEPKKLSPTFAVLEFASNVKVTLKQLSSLTPPSEIKGGGTELSIAVANKAALDKLYHAWDQQDIVFAQRIEESVYGFNFLALDPDGHRIRIFTY